MTNGNSPAWNMPQASVEAGLLSSINQSNERWLEVSSIFSSEDFVGNREIFRWFGTYLAQYGNLPTASQITVKFGWSPPIGDYGYWLGEMRRYALARKVLEAIQEGYGQITDPDKALSLLLEKLSLIRSQQNNHI